MNSLVNDLRVGAIFNGLFVCSVVLLFSKAEAKRTQHLMQHLIQHRCIQCCVRLAILFLVLQHHPTMLRSSNQQNEHVHFVGCLLQHCYVVTNVATGWPNERNMLDRCWIKCCIQCCVRVAHPLQINFLQI